MNKSNFDTIYVFCCYCSEGDFQQVFCLKRYENYFKTDAKND